MIRRRFVFDINRCTGCDACRVACFVENGFHEPGVREWRKIHTYNKTASPGAPRFHLSLACQHCSDPACLRACPTLAYRVDEESGAVLFDAGRCIGCRYCIWACPYGAPVFDSHSGTVSKCTLCHDRQIRGLAPACAALCPTGALDVEERRGEMTDRAFRVGSFPGAHRHDPALRVLPLREGRFESSRGPEAAELQDENLHRTILIREEWPLVLFTYVATILTALFAGSLFRRMPIPEIGFLLAGAAAMALSTTHLGHPLRAWRAVRNAHSSPLSREIIFYSLFLAAAALSFALKPAGLVIVFPFSVIAALAGAAFLISVDQVYQRLRPKGERTPHSAGAFSTGAFLAALFAGALPLAAIVGLARAALYVTRKWRAVRLGRPVHGVACFLRMGLGFILPALLYVAAPAHFELFAVVLILGGELIDRVEYYVDLRLAGPEQMMVNFASNRTGVRQTV